MYSVDSRWRAITLHYAYSVPCEQVARIFGRKVNDPELLAFRDSYVKQHSCFYVEKLQVQI
ncbi:hypothetical protein PHMEG_0001761 [Phytophthora megakarya]|uniref:Uncharacterized protein n=1 Tax=Phytophthora megakarya TaxID=4795 RepID=A0A225X2D2_9STRA|nr:hypothetical protein PHMEG_0001761 [Phytophthora megakarya]